MRATPHPGPQVVHAIPGRIRVRLAGWSGQGRQQLENLLLRVHGVRDAQANPLTGNVLVSFDPHTTTEAVVVAALGGVGSRLPPPGQMNDPEGVAACASGSGTAKGESEAPGRFPLLGAGLAALVGHALADGLFYAVAFAEPFGLPLAGFGLLHLGFDAFVCGALLLPLLAGSLLERTASRRRLCPGATVPTPGAAA